jgi:hypothetical protein
VVLAFSDRVALWGLVQTDGDGDGDLLLFVVLFFVLLFCVTFWCFVWWNLATQFL